MGAPPALAATFTVNTTADAVDAAPGNGVCLTGGGQCSLRAAIQEANALPPPPIGGPHIVNLPNGTFTLTIPGRDELASTQGDLNVTVAGGGIVIQGQSATQTIIQAGATATAGIDRVFRIQSGANNVSIQRLTIQHGTAGQSGAPRPGGGVLNDGALSLVQVEVRENRANSDPNQAGGGGIANGPGATMLVTQSAVIDNTSVSNGAGISNQGNLTVDTSTIANNVTGGAVGGVFNFNAPSTVLRNVTLVGNQAPSPTGGGLGAFPNSPAFRVANSILDSPSGGNCSNTTTLVSEGFNISSDATCNFGQAPQRTIDKSTTPSDLSGLGLHGGPTRNFVPLPGSAALDGGKNVGPCGGTTTPDQRGLARAQSAPNSALDCDIGSVEVPTVGVLSGLGDSAPVAAPSAACRTSTAGCTLRQAVLDANEYGGAAISLANGTHSLTRAGRDEDAGQTGDLDVTAPIIVVGSLTGGQPQATVQAGSTNANGIDRIFHVLEGGQLTIRNVTLQFGRAVGTGVAGQGGAILSSGPLTLEGVVVRDSRADSSGGGIRARIGGLSLLDTEVRDNISGVTGGGISSSVPSTIERSTVANNSTTSGSGGGLDFNSFAGASSIARSTFSGNQAPSSAAIDIANSLPASFTLTRVSVVDNANTTTGGATVRISGSGANVVRGSLFAENPAPNCDFSGSSNVTGGDNLSDDATCAAGTNNRFNLDPVLGQLRDNGARTRTHAFMPGSPAIDTGPTSAADCGDRDQRGVGSGYSFPGTADGDETPGARCDVGAFEVQRFVVETGDDFPDVSLADGTCGHVTSNGVGGLTCSLRAAVQEANAQGHAAVTVPAGTYTLTRAGPNENAGSDGDLDVTAGLTLFGAAANTTIIQAGTTTSNGIDRLFDIRPGAIARIQGVTIRHGRLAGDGAGIRNTSVLTLTDVELTRNNATPVSGIGGSGGGLSAETGSTTVLRRMTFAENTATDRGGAINADGVMTLENVTLSANTASGRGGAIYNDALLTINNSTFILNSATSAVDQGNAIWVNTGTVTISNNIFARNSLSRDDPCKIAGGTFTSLGFNKDSAVVTSSPSRCTRNVTGDGPHDANKLGGLAFNGGQTRTHAVLDPTANIVSDGGNPAAPLDGRTGRCAATDQRNLPRPRDSNGDGTARCEPGAFELQPTGTFSVGVPQTTVTPGDEVFVNFTWTVPSPLNWHDLEWLALRLVDTQGRIVFWVRWTEADNRFTLLDADGNERGSGATGTAGVLSTDRVSLILKDAKALGSGPTGPSVTVILPLVFAEAASDQSFTVQVAARADDASEDPFVDAGRIVVGSVVKQAPSPGDDDSDEDKPGRPDRPRRPTEEQREQRERTNRGGLDDHRIEGNVVAVDREASPPTVTIAARDGLVVLQLSGEAATVTAKVGDYVTATGEKVNEHLYEIDSLSVEKR